MKKSFFVAVSVITVFGAMVINHAARHDNTFSPLKVLVKGPDGGGGKGGGGGYWADDSHVFAARLPEGGGPKGGGGRLA